MSTHRSILEVLINITDISNNRKLGFQEKLNQILLEIVDCMHVKKGSIMLFKDRKTLEVVASTNPEIIGVRQTLDADFPSSWVVRNKRPLYIDKASQSDFIIKRFEHYKGEAFFLVPIIDNNRVIGVVNVTEKDGTDIFSEEEQKMLLHVAAQVIIALENNRLAESLKAKKKILQKKNLKLRKLEKLRTELFNMLIHDLKGPVSEIVANLDILSYTVKDENIGFVEIAQTGCSTLYNMVSNLLDIARLEEGKLSLVYEEISPKELIKESLSRLLVSVRSKELKFAEQFPESDAVTFQGDRTLLIRVLQNLLTNAIHYSPHGETITVGFQSVKSMKVEFFVKDNGPGVPEQYREIIFDKYKQLDKKFDGRTYTTGLGLAFCRMAVGAHGGRIAVESGGEKGSRFFFVIPEGKKKKL